MLAALIGTLALTASSVLDVPYVPQSDALCGGAAVAMVYRYWGDSHAGAAEFAPLVDRQAGGIAEHVLAEAVRQRGWTAAAFEGSIEQLRASLADGRPIIVLLGERARRYHYVVVIGATPDHIVIHDPSWGPSRSVSAGAFVQRWKASRFASLLVLPPAGGVDTAPPRAASGSLPLAAAPVTHCDSLLAAAVESVQRQGLAAADTVLDRVRSECPQSAGPLRELAGVRFGQRRWSDAAALARQALALNPADSYAWDVLGSSLFMQNDSRGALRAWNRIGRPRLNEVRISGLQRTRYQRVTEALRLEAGDLLTADAFERARRRLNELPDRTNARLSLRPEADGFASIEVVMHERDAIPRGAAEWGAASLRTGIDRELTVAIPGATGQGELWSAAWRWWDDRPRVSLSFAAPRGGRLPGIWRVDAMWEAQTYVFSDSAPQPIRESRTHGGLTFAGWATGALRYAITGGIDSWNSSRRDALAGLSLEHVWLDDRISVAADARKWIPLSADPGFSSIAGRLRFATSGRARWDYRADVGAEHVSAAAPLALWSGAGEGRAREALLRAHPLLDGGTINAGPGSAFGRSLISSSIEGWRWLDRPQLPRLAIAMFGDAARTSRAFARDPTFNVDVGTGLRIRIPGWQSVLRIDVAHGLRDGRNALTFGWTR
jgi:peptidase C39-like protein